MYKQLGLLDTIRIMANGVLGGIVLLFRLFIAPTGKRGYDAIVQFNFDLNTNVLSGGQFEILVTASKQIRSSRGVRVVTTNNTNETISVNEVIKLYRVAAYRCSSST